MKKRAAGRETIRKGRLLQAHEERLRDAYVLLRGGRWSGAIYVAGYVIECLLKAAILSRVGLSVLPSRYWHHDLERLVVDAHLRRELEAEMSDEMEQCMGLLSRAWDVSIRYQPGAHERCEAEEFLLKMETVRRWLLARI